MPAMTPRYALRLGDCAARGVVLRAACWHCRNAADLDLAALLARFGEHEPVRRLDAKLRCTACATKPAVLTVVWPE